MPRDPVGSALVQELFSEIQTWPIYDPHSHIDPHRPAARSLDEILGYHYYTELAHSAGMPAELVTAVRDPRERVRNLATHLHRIDNTVQYSWFLEIARAFHGVDDEELGPREIDRLFDKAEKGADGPAWDATVWKTTNLEAVFLTNDFDDRLTGWDTTRYVPCLRVDDLVMKLHLASTRQRLENATNMEVVDEPSLRLAIGALFSYFVEHGARACAISLPPDFKPAVAARHRASTSLRRALHQMDLRTDEHQEIRQTVFWMLAEFCKEYRLPFDLMIGPMRDVYPAGVHGGRDLFDRRVSLADYRDLFNNFPTVTFPISTLSPDAGGELVAFSWIFPNVVPLGHWWYSNIPVYIEQDLRGRLQAVPKTKLVGYYSDAYKLEFVLPKFKMYRRSLCQILSECIRDRGWSIERAIEVARLVLLENPRRIFSREAS